MALHGEVKVNGEVLAYWQAVRQEPIVLDADQVSTYRCEVSTHYGAVEKFTVEHRYGDGALVLLRKIMSHELIDELSSLDC